MKLKLLVLTAIAVTFCLQSFGQPANDNPAGAIPITPSPVGSGCATPAFNLPFSTDGTTDSGQQGSCTSSGLDQFFTWTATTTGLFFSSEEPGNPGIVVWDAVTGSEIACTNTFAAESLFGWNVGDDLLIQIYDFAGTDLVDIAFCLNELNYIPPPPIPITFSSQSAGSSGTQRAVVDMNGDFLDDMVSISTTNVNIREQNPGGGFTTKNITTPPADWLPSWSLAAADYDRNGYTDLLYGSGDGVTFMRANSTGTGFTEFSTDISVLDIFSQRSNFVDIDNDGNLDAFVCHDVQPNVYFLNDGTGALTQYQSNVTPNAPYNLGDYPSGGNYGSIWIDYDNDRDLDMFIAKCGGETARRTNEMHTNDNGTFSENAADLGLADPMQTWSAAWGDFDKDGDMDVFIGASSGAHKLMRNNLIGTGTMDFTDITAGSGLSVLTSNSIETVTFDFDNDGNLDLVNGGNILIGNGDMTFNVYTNIFGNGGAYGDLNNDGYIDAFHNGVLYLNNAESNNNWIKIHTVGVESNIHGIGARIEIHTDSGVQMRDVKSGDGFRYMNSLNTHIGLGSDTSINEIVVYWPTSGCESFSSPGINQGITITEGTGVRCDAVVSPRVFLQGPAFNPNTGEDNLMRDTLRAEGWLTTSATTSPYADALVADASVFNTTGDNAIVDWVFVELRDENDNSIVLGSQSALLQRDGDVVGIDGTSPLVFSQLEGRSFVAVKHRNHLGIISDDPQSLNLTNSIVDLSFDAHLVEGTTSAVIELSNGKFAMFGGDYNGNEQVQNTDVTAVIQLIGSSGYDNADMDANAQVQNSDVNALVNPNIGRGQQFMRLDAPADPLEPEITLAFANAQITNDGTDNYYEADIVISSTEDFYLGSGQVYFDYNTLAFGENISSGGSVEYVQPPGSILGFSFGQFSPAYKDFIQNDNTNSRVSLSFQQNIGGTGLETAPEIQVTSAPKPLFRIKFKYIDAGVDANVCFYNDGVFQDQFFTACGGAATADCTTAPGMQLFDDNYDCSEAAVETLGVNSNALSSTIKLHPNPVDNILYLEGELNDISQIDIYSINGRLVKTIDSGFNKIDVSQLETAVYLLKVYTSQGIAVKRLIKQ